jgi:hypothetical protein
MFTFAFLALDVTFSDGTSWNGEFDGFGGIYGATFLFTLRLGVGDFNYIPFRDLPRL